MPKKSKSIVLSYLDFFRLITKTLIPTGAKPAYHLADKAALRTPAAELATDTVQHVLLIQLTLAQIMHFISNLLFAC